VRRLDSAVAPALAGEKNGVDAAVDGEVDGWARAVVAVAVGV